MRVKQISVFLENKAGRLAEVTSIIAEADINIRALSVADTSDFGVLRLIVDKNKKAEEVLKNQGFTVRKTDVVAVEVKDRPGGLYKILATLNNSGVNVEYMYAFIQQSKKNAVMIFRFDNIEETVDLLEENDIKVLTKEQIYSM